MAICIGMRVKVVSVAYDAPEGDQAEAYIGMVGTVVKFYPYTGGEFLPPHEVRFDDGESLSFYGRELCAVEA